MCRNTDSYRIPCSVCADTDDLPTILPPKRRRHNTNARQNNNNNDNTTAVRDGTTTDTQQQQQPQQQQQQEVGMQDPLMEAQGTERIMREFPRHNWLQHKILQRASISPPPSTPTPTTPTPPTPSLEGGAYGGTASSDRTNGGGGGGGVVPPSGGTGGDACFGLASPSYPGDVSTRRPASYGRDVSDMSRTPLVGDVRRSGPASGDVTIGPRHTASLAVGDGASKDRLPQHGHVFPLHQGKAWSAVPPPTPPPHPHARPVPPLLGPGSVSEGSPPAPNMTSHKAVSGGACHPATKWPTPSHGQTDWTRLEPSQAVDLSTKSTLTLAARDGTCGREARRCGEEGQGTATCTRQSVPEVTTDTSQTSSPARNPRPNLPPPLRRHTPEDLSHPRTSPLSGSPHSRRSEMSTDLSLSTRGISAGDMARRRPGSAGWTPSSVASGGKDLTQPGQRGGSQDRQSPAGKLLSLLVFLLVFNSQPPIRY